MTSQFRLAALAGLVLSASVALAPAQAQQIAELNFGVISTEASINQKKNWDPFVDAMSKSIGVKVKAFYATDYAGVIEAMRFNKVHLAWYGNKSGIEAVERANGEVLARVVTKDGGTGYYSHIIVRPESPLKTIDDLMKCDKMLNFGIGDPNSTSGFVVPISYVFAPRDIEPRACFKTVRNANHQANAMAVANKQVDAATNNSEDLQRLEKTAPEARKNIRILWTSPIIPLDPIVWRKDLDPVLKTKIYSFLLGYGRVGSDEQLKAEREVMANLLWSPFLPANDHHLLPIRKLEATKDLMKFQGDEKLSATDKAAKIAQIKAELVRIEDSEKLAASDAFQKRVAQFVAADKAGDMDKSRRLIAEFAAAFAGTH